MTDYRSLAIEALVTCQTIEFSLKVYIGQHYKITQILLRAYSLPHRFDARDVESSSLERLVNVFCKVNNNDAFQSSLRRFVASRNHIAHQALLHDSPASGMLQTDMEIEKDKVSGILHEGTQVAIGLAAEIRMLTKLANSAAVKLAV